MDLQIVTLETVHVWSSLSTKRRFPFSNLLSVLERLGKSGSHPGCATDQTAPWAS